MFSIEREKVIVSGDKLKAITGMHTTEFVRQVRLSRAVRLLREQIV